MYQYSDSTNETKLRKIFLISALISVIPFIYIAFGGVADWASITELDYEIGAYFYDWRAPVRTEIVIAITRIGNVLGQVAIAIIITAALVLRKKWRTGLWYGLNALIGAAGLNQLMKEFFKRVRPDEIDHLIEQGGYSFPSGHSMGSMILFGSLLFVIIRYINSRTKDWLVGKIVLGVAIMILILLIGLSRIYLGVHYPSDVIGGFSLGLSFLLFSIAVFGLPITKQDFQAQNRYRFKRL